MLSSNLNKTWPLNKKLKTETCIHFWLVYLEIFLTLQISDQILKLKYKTRLTIVFLPTESTDWKTNWNTSQFDFTVLLRETALRNCLLQVHIPDLSSDLQEPEIFP